MHNKATESTHVGPQLKIDTRSLRYVIAINVEPVIEVSKGL